MQQRTHFSPASVQRPKRVGKRGAAMSSAKCKLRLVGHLFQAANIAGTRARTVQGSSEMQVLDSACEDSQCVEFQRTYAHSTDRTMH